MTAKPHGVLLTRPANDAAPTAKRIASLGFTPVLAPLLRLTQFPSSVPAGVQAILVTSGNALATLPVRDVPLLAVGDVTAARARDRGFTHVTSAGRDAAALLDLACVQCDPAVGPLLLASGRGQGLALAAALRARGFSVVRRVFYATAPVPRFPTAAEQALTTGALHAAMFLSAETAAAFVRLLPPALYPPLSGVLALAIGKPVADALKPLPWRGIALAAAPTLDDVLALL